MNLARMVLMGIRTVTIGWSIEGNIGAKYWKNDVNVDYAIYNGETEITSDSFKEPQEWTDLMLGIRSKISWNFTFVNTFKVLNFLDVTAGYRTFSYRRVDGEGDTEIETKITAFGPVLGVSFVF